ncbi:hypothetical protein WJX73_007012 [Symbiochloris irregularis]|uniref:Cupin type-1 domain-containing protein n=1 Tax=Symbiochloris irregularis TaxID=706552 RepID=A0AAW1NGU8_9CHLO
MTFQSRKLVRLLTDRGCNKFAVRSELQPGSQMSSTACQVAVVALIRLAAATVVSAQSDDPPPPYVPVNYTRLYATQDGQTHLANCTFGALPADSAGSLYGKTVASANGVYMLQVPVNVSQPPHNAPSSQFVTILSGTAFFNTSDGNQVLLTAGDLLYQDNTKESPASSSPQHSSGNAGTEPVNMMLTFLNVAPTVDVQCPTW